jgi:YfiH family protein
VIAGVGEQRKSVDLTCHLTKSQLLGAETWLRHGITQRVPGLGRADGNVGYTAPRDEADAWEMRQQWARAIGVDPRSLTRVRQHHGNTVHVASKADLLVGASPSTVHDSPVADALITIHPDIALTTLHADCLAILLADPDNRAVAAIHAGWRSTVLDVAGETVRAMQRHFGTDPSRLLAYVGPSIGIDRYEVGDEVADAWLAIGAPDDRILRPSGPKWRFDLKQANATLLLAAGLRPETIEVSDVCTATDGEHWFSHRGQGASTGRFAAIISIRGDM